MAVKDPLDIEAEMIEQKQKCDFLLNQKNDLIGYLKNELKRMDDAYFEDLNKQVTYKLHFFAKHTNLSLNCYFCLHCK